MAAVANAAQVATTAAVALADKVTQSAEALRATVEAQRVTTAEGQAAALGPITTRLDTVLAAQIAGQGERSGVVSASEVAARTRNTIISVLVAVAAVLGVYVAAHNGTAKQAPAPIICQGNPVVCK